ncbi:MAG: cob(I)yrinic acid a,c-diamide adenosyltransferase [Bdellovibrionales bacterium]|nr:cob(I)yrinic acid a,c-diamide adenosyltransferase [Bdellovibrionales bacterium]
MKIYTKSGDQGETSLWGGGRVMKSHPRVNAYGTVDEANSMIGLAVSFFPSNENAIKERLIRIQNELFQVGSELATQNGASSTCPFVEDAEISRLEMEIDEMESSLPPLKNFILPNGSSAGSALHLARTIVRRSERECVDLGHNEPVRQELVRYLNRLSDYLFVMARHANLVLGQSETKWIPPKK